jgi:hypothetical protein
VTEKNEIHKTKSETEQLLFINEILDIAPAELIEHLRKLENKHLSLNLVSIDSDTQQFDLVYKLRSGAIFTIKGRIQDWARSSQCHFSAEYMEVSQHTPWYKNIRLFYALYLIVTPFYIWLSLLIPDRTFGIIVLVLWFPVFLIAYPLFTLLKPQRQDIEVFLLDAKLLDLIHAIKVEKGGESAMQN